MPKSIRLVDYTVAPGGEFAVSSYPGPGGYLTQYGIALVVAPEEEFDSDGDPNMTSVIMINYGKWRDLLKDDPVIKPGEVDVHRLLDQMIALTT